jgi:hypothetical protein
MIKKIICLIIIIIGLQACAGRSSQHVAEDATSATGDNKKDATTETKTEETKTDLYLDGTISILWKNHAHDIGATYALDTTTTEAELPTNLNQIKEFKSAGTITSIPVVLKTETKEIAYYTVREGSDVKLYSTENHADTKLINLTTDASIHSTQPALFTLDTSTYIVVPGKDKAVIVNLKTKETTNLNYNQTDTGQRIFVDSNTIYVQGINKLHTFTIEKKTSTQQKGNLGSSSNKELNVSTQDSIDINNNIPSNKLLPIVKASNDLYFEAGNNSICKIDVSTDTLGTPECKETATGFVGNLIAKKDTVYYTVIKPNYFLHPSQDEEWFKSDVTNDTIISSFKTNNLITMIDQKPIFKELCSDYAINNEYVKDCITTYTTTLRKYNDNTDIDLQNTNINPENTPDRLHLGNTHHTALVAENNNLFIASNVGFQVKDSLYLVNKTKQYNGYSLEEEEIAGLIELGNPDSKKIIYDKVNSEETYIGTLDYFKYEHSNTIGGSSKKYKIIIDFDEKKTVRISKVVDYAIVNNKNNLTIQSYRNDIMAQNFNTNLNLGILNDKNYIINAVPSNQTWIKEPFKDRIKEYPKQKPTVCTQDSCQEVPTDKEINGLSVGDGTVYIVTEDTLYTTNQ